MHSLIRLNRITLAIILTVVTCLASLANAAGMSCQAVLVPKPTLAGQIRSLHLQKQALFANLNAIEKAGRQFTPEEINYLKNKEGLHYLQDDMFPQFYENKVRSAIGEIDTKIRLASAEKNLIDVGISVPEKWQIKMLSLLQKPSSPGYEQNQYKPFTRAQVDALSVAMDLAGQTVSSKRIPRVRAEDQTPEARKLYSDQRAKLIYDLEKNERTQGFEILVDGGIPSYLAEGYFAKIRTEIFGAVEPEWTLSRQGNSDQVLNYISALNIELQLWKALSAAPDSGTLDVEKKISSTEREIRNAKRTVREEEINCCKGGCMRCPVNLGIHQLNKSNQGDQPKIPRQVPENVPARLILYREVR
ncbi:MAG: hypothetical protein V4736_03745 [Bdellovibrionota bacterium]